MTHDPEAAAAFFQGRRFAVLGASAPGRLQGPVLMAALRHAGKEAVAVDLPDPAPESILPELAEVDGVVLLPPAPWGPTAEAFVNRAAEACRAAGVTRVWLYPAGPPTEPIRAAVNKGLQIVSTRCPCLYIEGAGFPHNLHRWLLRVTGRL